MASFLIRLDDIHPKMNHNRFDRMCKLLDKYDIKPILGVIPNNLDENLNNSPEEDNKFFSKIKELQENRYIISLHGYEHKYINNNPGIMNINNYSEFAGLTYKEQNYKISEALKIFNMNNINTNMFMAPAHSFDAITIEVLKNNNIQLITDGFYLYPYFKNNIWWIPQQFWAFRNIKLNGLFTFCFHIDSFSDEEFEIFMMESNTFFKNNQEKFIDLNQLDLNQFNSFKYKLMNIIFNSFYKILYRLKHKK
jgi:predicted deacetylase